MQRKPTRLARLEMHSKSLHMERNWELALIDLDGTLYRGLHKIAGAAEFVQRLRDRGIRPVFFTNNSTRTPLQVCDKLAMMGLMARPDEVCTSAQASAAYVCRMYGTGARVLYIGHDGLLQALREAGLIPLDVREVKNDTHPPVCAAVMGLDQTIAYSELTTFCEAVMRLKHFVLTNGDVRVPSEEGFLPGNGAFGSFVSTATGITPYVAGKPNPEFIGYALEHYGVAAQHALLVGDNVETDIAAGNLAGVYSIQVLSGVQYENALDGVVSEPCVHLHQADEVHASVADLFVSGEPVCRNMKRT